MLSGLGTAREQWVDAGIELHLGRISARELHELGERLLNEDSAERYRESDLHAQIVRLEERLADREDDVAEADRDMERLERENRELRKRIATLEGSR